MRCSFSTYYNLRCSRTPLRHGSVSFLSTKPIHACICAYRRGFAGIDGVITTGIVLHHDMTQDILRLQHTLFHRRQAWHATFYSSRTFWTPMPSASPSSGKTRVLFYTLSLNCHEMVFSFAVWRAGGRADDIITTTYNTGRLYLPLRLPLVYVACSRWWLWCCCCVRARRTGRCHQRAFSRTAWFVPFPGVTTFCCASGSATAHKRALPGRRHSLFACRRARV